MSKCAQPPSTLCSTVQQPLKPKSCSRLRSSGLDLPPSTLVSKADSMMSLARRLAVATVVGYLGGGGGASSGVGGHPEVSSVLKTHVVVPEHTHTSHVATCAAYTPTNSWHMAGAATKAVSSSARLLQKASCIFTPSTSTGAGCPHSPDHGEQCLQEGAQGAVLLLSRQLQQAAVQHRRQLPVSSKLASLHMHSMWHHMQMRSFELPGNTTHRKDGGQAPVPVAPHTPTDRQGRRAQLPTWYTGVCTCTHVPSGRAWILTGK